MQCFISLYFAKRTVGNILINGAIVKQAIPAIIAYITSNVRQSGGYKTYGIPTFKQKQRKVESI